MAKRLLAWYGGCMSRRPLLTNLATAVPLMACGDVLAQRIEGKRRVDAARTLTMVCYSATVFTPLFFKVYRWVDTIGVRGGRFRVAATKSLIVVLVGGVPANATFLTLATAVEMRVFGKRARGDADLPTVVWGKLLHELPVIMCGSLSFWGPVNVINFTYFKTYRLVFSSAAATVWNCFLSLVQHEYVSADSDNADTVAGADTKSSAPTALGSDGVATATTARK